MKQVQPKFTEESTIVAFQYDPSKSDPMPQGFNARTTSRGAEATFQRPDGIVFHMAPFDWAVKVDDGDWIVLHDPCYRALFQDII